MAARTAHILNPTRRLVVRLGLATGATVSGILGAQTLATLDLRPASISNVDTKSANLLPNSAANGNTILTATQESSASAISTITIASPTVGVNSAKAPAAPQIIIIRNSGTPASVAHQSVTTANRPTRSNIVPAIGNIVPPNAVIVQGVAPSGGGSGVSSGGGGGSHIQPAPVSAPTGH